MITAVHVDLFSDLNPIQAPSETHLTSGVFLRNQNQVPIAAFSKALSGTTSIVLNGSASYDPEGQSLRYVWWDNGTKITNGDGIVFTYPVAAHTSHSLQLHVFDPGGLEGVSNPVGFRPVRSTMTSRLNDERGWALVTAMIFMAMMLGTVLAVARYVDSQTKLGADSRKRETAFNMSEAALNGQMFALTQEWPGQGDSTTPDSTCTQASTGSRCPNASALANLIPSADTNGATWQTLIRDNGGSSPNFYSDAITLGQPAYDANNDKQVWVRATSPRWARRARW